MLEATSFLAIATITALFVICSSVAVLAFFLNTLNSSSILFLSNPQSSKLENDFSDRARSISPDISFLPTDPKVRIPSK